MAGELLTGSAVQEVERITREAAYVAGKVTSIDGVPLSTVPLHDARKMLPEPKPLVVHTLEALVHYIKCQLDALAPVADEHPVTAVHIVDHARVDLISDLRGTFQQRFCFARAELVDRLGGFQFGRFYPADEFNIAILTRFEDDSERAYVLQLVGNIKADSSVVLRDDGASQKVETRAGISMTEFATVRNPVTLRPYRTFHEIEQPASAFILRVKEGSQGGVGAALFEADGAQWQVDAVERIRDYLNEQDLGDFIPIIG